MKSTGEVIDFTRDWIQDELKQTGSMKDLMILPEMTETLAGLVSVSS